MGLQSVVNNSPAIAVSGGIVVLGQSVYTTKNYMSDGTVKAGKLYIGEDVVLDVATLADQDVFVGIRPEGFELADDGALGCDLINVEVMGRDVSVVSANPAACTASIRSIIDADHKIDVTTGKIRYNIKPHKCLLFNKETEERLY